MIGAASVPSQRMIPALISTQSGSAPARRLSKVANFTRVPGRILSIRPSGTRKSPDTHTSPAQTTSPVPGSGLPHTVSAR